ncbi:MAG TPA: DUF4126 domain-containing protein [Lacipirellulaceae bacterium]|nr:DUF4126 domain-containing protein [Lacipirellulaceae bacterium]
MILTYSRRGAFDVEFALATLLGIGLAASCGFRVFAPLLVTSAATYGGYLQLTAGFEWIATLPALLAFAVATLFETLAYYVPWFDNLLDTVASPLAVIAGMVLFAAAAIGLDPFLKWTLAIIAGGGSAAVVQGGTVFARGASTAMTGGLANFVISTFELFAGVFFPVVAIVVPLVAVVLLAAVVTGMYAVARRLMRRRRPA